MCYYWKNILALLDSVIFLAHKWEYNVLQIPLFPCDPITTALMVCVFDGPGLGNGLVMTQERRLIFEP